MYLNFVEFDVLRIYFYTQTDTYDLTRVEERKRTGGRGQEGRTRGEDETRGLDETKEREKRHGSKRYTKRKPIQSLNASKV